jgi:hypothetical protein
MDIESQVVTGVPAKKPLLPVISVCIGTFALCFQVFVLYPWHIQLSAQFADMQQICLER